ncbi:MAG: S9 family peptidase, partial [Proteobacteria bacterium]|nr:S9 family peptidase [Pseudomonadota bacterium]
PHTEHLPHNVESLALSHDGKHLAFTTNEDGYAALHLFNTLSRQERRLDIENVIVSRLRFARNAGVLAFNVSSPTVTTDVYTYELATDELTRWTQSEIGGLNPDNFVAPTLFEYTSFDGLEIPAFYFRPPGDGPFPVVIAVHGGPEAQSRPFFSSRTQYLVNEDGIAVLMPNVRGSSGYGKDYLSLDNGKNREDSVKDIGSLLDWIEEQPELDSSHVGIVGGSYGGYLVLASLVHYSDRIVAGNDIEGISNFVTFLQNTPRYRQDLRRAEYGDERKMEKFLHEISPLTHADKIKSALFVAHGANDPRIPLSEAEQIVKAVQMQGQDVWFMVAHNEGHGYRKKENIDTMAQLQMMFFEKYLTNK